jgi:hypothetical protein
VPLIVIFPDVWGITKKRRFFKVCSSLSLSHLNTGTQISYNPLNRISQRIFTMGFALCNHKRETITDIIYHYFLLFFVLLFMQPNGRKE